jgi:hypothetical protein
VAEKSIILAATYVVVLFTIVVQGLSLRALVERVVKKQGAGALAHGMPCATLPGQLVRSDSGGRLLCPVPPPNGASRTLATKRNDSNTQYD